MAVRCASKEPGAYRGAYCHMANGGQAHEHTFNACLGLQAEHGPRSLYEVELHVTAATHQLENHVPPLENGSSRRRSTIGS
jgi:hypothetical protein